MRHVLAPYTPNGTLLTSGSAAAKDKFGSGFRNIVLIIVQMNRVDRITFVSDVSI